MTKENGIKREWGIFCAKILEWTLNVLGFVLARVPHSWFVGCVRALGFVFYKLDRRRYYDAKANLDFGRKAQWKR